MNISMTLLYVTVGILAGVGFLVNSKTDGRRDENTRAPRKVFEAGTESSPAAPKAALPGESTAAKERSTSRDWLIPPTAESAVTLEPARVFDILGSAGLQGTSGGYLLSDGCILFWGDGKELTEHTVSLINPADGRVETIWQGSCVNIRGVFLSPDRQVAWVITEDVSKPDGFFVIDIAGRRAWPSHRLYTRETLSRLESAVDDHKHYQTQIGPDGSLLLEWSNWWPIANWWGKSPEFWQMTSTKKEENVFSRAIMSSPKARFRQENPAMVPVTFEVSVQGRIPKEHRPEPDPSGHRYAPITDGFSYSSLRAVSLPTFGLSVQLFNRYFDPRTMNPCGAGNEVGDGELRVWSSSSSSTCARFQGAYVERAKDGKLLHVLNHGIGVPEGSAVIGRLFAMSGISEEPVIAKYVSLWDAPDGRLLARLALPRQAVGYTYPYTVLFSNDAREVYCMTSYPKPMLFVWRLNPEWALLGSLAEVGRSSYGLRDLAD